MGGAHDSAVQIYRLLYQAYGPQHWWPVDSPFEVMVGALLTQNTNWKNVEKAITGLKHADMLDAERIAACDISTLEEIIRPCGYFRQKAARLQKLCRFYIGHDGLSGLQAMPTGVLHPRLLALHGIGPETADSILLYALDRPLFVIDAYTRRIFARLGLTPPGAGYAMLQQWFNGQLPRDAHVFNEFHALIVEHAKRHCRAKPDCIACPLRQCCDHFTLQN